MTSTHFTEKTRLYVQLRPDNKTLNSLQAMRSKIEEGRPVPDNELHMTVIHIGELSRLIATLPEIDSRKILQAAEVCADELNRITATYRDELFVVQSSGLNVFGKTTAITYEPSQKLNELHSKSLQIFMNMLESVGVNEPRTFMENDANLRFALTLRPHVALAKNASLPDDLGVEGEGAFELMKVVY